MTLPPIDSWQVRGVAGPEYKVSARCANPTCRRISEHAHHMWRRRQIENKDWVELPDGYIVQSKVGLCPRCHDRVTGRVGGHTAAIRMAPDHVFWWCDFDSGQYDFVAPLEPQPSTQEALVASPADQTESENDCPTCGQPRARKKKSPGGSRRARKTWPVKVPADAEENGAEVLDSLTEDLAPLLGVDPDKDGRYTSGRYYVLVPALYFAQTKRDEFVKSILGRD